MKKIVKISLLLLLTSCTVYNFRTISGRYRTKGGFEWGSSIILKQDSNFVYNWQIGGLFGKETGKWSLKGNNLILNSDFHRLKDTTPNFYLLDKKINNSSKIELQLYFSDSTELIGANGLMFYDTDTIFKSVSDTIGLMTFPKQDYDSIKISFIGLKDIVIADSTNDYFKIVSVDFPVDYMFEYFENEVWKIRGKRLIDKTKNEYYYEKRFYKIE
ncbi:hypothetical protein [Marinifilum fragile]|uniref:hypothetical protein n=1 Tax=Marinifilum fragile TaxID=570161 RepID=UPI002AAAF168|nr:hypothetical protein [Marinifilum fragile]